MEKLKMWHYFEETVIRFLILVATLAAVYIVYLVLSPARPVIENIQERHYIVSGTDREAIIADIIRNGPGSNAAGLAEMHIHWPFFYCQVHLDATVHIPRHSDIESLDPYLRNRFTEFVQQLRVHEYTHVQIAREAAEQISTGRCWRGLFGALIISEWRERDTDFDNATNHGADTGAVF